MGCGQRCTGRDYRGGVNKIFALIQLQGFPPTRTYLESSFYYYLFKKKKNLHFTRK